MKISTIIDNDSAFTYEKIGAVRRAVDFVWIPFINLMSEEFGGRLISKSQNASDVKKHKTTHKALELMYDFDGKLKFHNGFVNGLFTYIWFHLRNPKAVRNRLKLVKKIIREIILTSKKTELNIMSLGAGSARAILEVLAEIEKKGINHPVVRAKFIDISETALNYSKELAEKLAIKSTLYWQLDKAQNLDNTSQNFRPDVIEMVGLLDYFNEEKALQLVKIIFEYLNDDGVLVSCNIMDNPEREFVNNVIDWRMIYRTEKDIESLIINSGFKAENASIIIEPLKIHCLFIAKK